MKNSNFLKVFSVLLAVCMAVMLCATPAVAVSTWNGVSASASLSGSGSAADPYLIKTAEDLKFFADAVNGGNDYSGMVIYLQADIDLDNQAFDPIGTTAHYFRGMFDGKNHTVSGINITTDNAAGTGFFGGLHNGWIKNLHLEGSVICTSTAAPNYIGGLVGYTSGNITIYNCSFNGLVRSANTDANSASYCGGLVGYLAATTGSNIVCSYTSGVVDAYGRIGGLIGTLENAASQIVNIKDSYSDATVTGSSAGTSSFLSTGQGGGLVGFLQLATINMTNCFFAGRAPYLRNGGFAGPIIHYKYSGTLNLTRVYFDNQKNILGTASAFTPADDGVGVNTSTLAYSTWGNFPTTFVAGNATLQHPLLRVAEMGKGTKDEPYVIDGRYDLQYLSYICGYGGLNVYNFRDDYIVFDNDIDLSSVASFTPIGSGYGPFYGNVDGKGHTVSNVTITMNHRQGVGFFGKTGNNYIKNLNVAGTVTNSMRPDTSANPHVSSPVAGFAAITEGTAYITNCSFSGTVTSANTLVSNGSGGWSTNDMNETSAGGLVGEARGHLTIDRCSVSGTVDGFGRSGGLLASLNGSLQVTITNSYCDATVTGKGPVDESLSYYYTAGGLIGFSNTGTLRLTNCFFAGTAPAAPAARNGMGGPIINHNAGGTFTCTNVYYLSDETIETYGEAKDAEWFASAAAATTLGGHFAEADPHPVFASPDLQGSGSETDPYLITSAEDFQAINAFVRGGYRLEDNYFKLVNDIVLNENYADYEDWGTTAPTNNWLPIGTNGSQFAGNLDGADHTIYGLYASYADSTTGTGFFGGTYRGTIKDLHIKNAYVSALYRVGGMSGFAQESTYINCSFEGIVYSTNETNYAGAAGGLIGEVGGGNKLERCMTAGTIDAYSRSAGIIGSATASGKNYIYDSYSVMDVTGLGTQGTPGSGTGGLIGLVQTGTVVIDSCFFAGSYPNGSANRGPIAGQLALGATVEDNNCWYLAGEADGLYGDICDADECTDGTTRDRLQGTRTEIVWIQGEDTPVLSIKGDLNCDTIIDLADAMMALRHINSVVTLSAGAASLADLNADGSINATDYSAIKVKALNAIAPEEEALVLSAWSNFG